MNVRAGSTCSGLTALQSDVFLVMLGHDASLAKEGKKPRGQTLTHSYLDPVFRTAA